MCFSRRVIVLGFIDWNNLIIGKLSPHIKVDSKNPIIKKNSEKALLQELALASHLGLVGVTFRLMQGIEHNANLARIICKKVTSLCTLQVYSSTKSFYVVLITCSFLNFIVGLDTNTYGKPS